MEKIKNSRKSFFKEIEGLRSIAVIGVILFHFWPNIFVGGFAGVTVFFVITGFFMTRKILRELANKGKFEFWQFYKRRFWRLYPAFFMMLIISTASSYLFFPNALYGIRGNFFSNLFYINNWYQIFHSVSYFASGNHWMIFTHLWAISLEAQFYIIWPILLYAILWVADRKWWQFSLVCPLGIIIVSSFLFSFLFSPTSTNRAYYGTDSRLFSFIFGGLVAIFISLCKSSYRPKLIYNIQRFLANFKKYILILSFIIFLIIFGIADGTKAWTYYLGMQLLSIVCSLMIYYFVVNKSTVLSKFLGNRLFIYLGSRGYSIYLYQLPVLVIFDHFIYKNSVFVIFLMHLCALLFIVFVADLSYRYIEMPFRFGIYGFKKKLGVNFYSFILLFLFLFSIIFSISGFFSRNATHLKQADQLKKRLGNNSKKIQKANRKVKNSPSLSSHANSSNSTVNKKEKGLESSYSLNKHEINKAQGIKINAIGDSLMLDVGPDIQKVIPNTNINAKVGMHTQDAISILQNLKSSKKLQPIILIMIGTNGDISKENLEQVKSIAGNRPVFWVNSFANDKPWIKNNNNLLNDEQKKDHSFHVVDWYSFIDKHLNLLSSDKVHPQPQGSEQMTRLIIHSITKFL